MYIHTYTHTLSPPPDCVASGMYVDSSLTPSNFGKLRLASSPLYSDSDQMYAVGYLEGYITAGE